MPNLPGGFELIIILVIVMVIFGGAKLPKLARSLREAKDEFEKSSKDEPKKGTAKIVASNALASDADEKVTMSKGDLDALLRERELKAKQD